MSLFLKGLMSMSTVKQCAIKLIEAMPEYKVAAFLHFIADKNEIARLETELMENDPDSGTYNSFEEFMHEVEEELKHEV